MTFLSSPKSDILQGFRAAMPDQSIPMRTLPPNKKPSTLLCSTQPKQHQEREANKAGASGADMVTSEKHSLPAQMPSSCVGLLACNPKEGNICPGLCVFFLKDSFW